MDAKDPFSHDSVNTIQGIGREWALSCRHDPPHIRQYKNREREKGRPFPDAERKTSAGKRKGTGGHENQGRDGRVRDYDMKKLPTRKKLPTLCSSSLF